MLEAKSWPTYIAPWNIRFCFDLFFPNLWIPESSCLHWKVVQYNVTKVVHGVWASGTNRKKLIPKYCWGMEKLETLSFDSFLETWSERASPQGFSLGSLHHRNYFLSLCPHPRRRVGHTRPLPGLCQCRRGRFILHCSRGVSVFMVDGSL